MVVQLLFLELSPAIDPKRNTDITDSGSDSEPYRSGRLGRKSRVLDLQQWQIDYHLIPIPSGKAKASALNAKKNGKYQYRIW
jgi:hypothetical protein